MTYTAKFPSISGRLAELDVLTDTALPLVFSGLQLQGLFRLQALPQRNLILDVSTVANDGGGVISGTIPLPDGPYRIHIGPTASTTDPLAYSGINGQGSIVVIKNSQFSCRAPPLPVGESRLSFVDELNQITHGDALLTVRPSQFRLSTYSLRRHYPTDYRVGARSISLEAYPQ